MKERTRDDVKQRQPLPAYSVLEYARELQARSKMLCHRADKQRGRLRERAERYWEAYGRNDERHVS